MRTLITPELYRPDDLTANGTVNDAVALVEQWLHVDNDFHLYWLLPPRRAANYDRADVLADRERVTLIEAPSFMAESEHRGTFPESGYSEAQLGAIKEAIYDRLGYVDAVVDQHVTGRYDLYKWLLNLGGHEAARTQPVDLIANVHDLRLPFKRHGARYPNNAAMKAELLAATVADGLWFKAGVDARRMREYGASILQEDLLDRMIDDALETGSPIDFGEYNEQYAEHPEVFHVAGSGWGKKNPDRVVAVGERLYERYGIRTVMTNMDPILPAFSDREFIDAYPEADRETFAWALREGDLTVCASDHETMARTPFEQAASGQVLVLRDRPWIYDCVPEDYPLIGDIDELEALAIRAVERWDEAVAANRRLVAHVQRVRDPKRCGRRTYDDLRRRVETRVRDCGTRPEDNAVRAALAELGERVALDVLNERTARHTEDGSPVLDASHTLTDLVYALRAMGYTDTGTPGTPVFRATA